MHLNNNNNNNFKMNSNNNNSYNSKICKLIFKKINNTLTIH